jgi:hypothetical protein
MRGIATISKKPLTMLTGAISRSPLIEMQKTTIPQRRDKREIINPRTHLIHLEPILANLPVAITPDQFRKWERSGLAPRGIRLVSQKARPLFRVDEVCSWAQREFGKEFPLEIREFMRVIRSRGSCNLTSSPRKSKL